LHSAQQAGVTDLYLEGDPRLQNAAEALAAKKIKRDIYISAAMENFDRDLEEAARRGLDHQRLNTPEKRIMLQNFHAMFADQIEAAHSAGTKTHLVDVQDPVTINESGLRVMEHDGTNNDEIGKIIEERVSYDHDVAEQIVQTKSGKAIVFYGAAHAVLSTPGNTFRNPHNIDDALKAYGVKTAKILMTDEDHAATYKALRKFADDPSLDAKNRTYIQGVDIPHYIYTPASDTLTALEARTIKLEKSPTPFFFPSWP
jgi:hypothetical protein